MRERFGPRSVGSPSLLRHFFLTSKPYSYSCEVARAWCFAGLLSGRLIEPLLPGLWLLSAQTLLMWLYFNWQSDRLQRDPGRVVPPRTLVAAPLVAAVATSAYFCGWQGGLAPLVYAVSVLLYTCKARYPWAGPVGPAFRGVTVLAHFAMVAVTLGVTPSPSSLWIAAGVAFWHARRNLIGDGRDVERDRYELPVRYGQEVTVWVTRAAAILAALCIVMAGISARARLLSLIFLGLDAVAWELVIRRIPLFSMASYTFHRFLVVFAVLVYVSPVWELVTAPYIVLLVGTAAGLNPCYAHLPGKTFPKAKDIWAVVSQK